MKDPSENLPTRQTRVAAHLLITTLINALVLYWPCLARVAQSRVVRNNNHLTGLQRWSDDTLLSKQVNDIKPQHINFVVQAKFAVPAGSLANK